jgi:uncharacterized membrane protein YfcA
VSVDPTVLAVVAAAFGAGLVDAMVGGGGLLQVPALFAAFPVTPAATLLGTGKFAGLCGTGASAWRYARAVPPDWRRLTPLIAIALVTSALGAVLASHAPAGLFRPLVPVLLTAVLLYTLVRKDLGRDHAPRFDRGSALKGGALVALIGTYDGFFGPGTGSFFMFMLVRVYGFDFLNAAAAARLLNAATNLAALAWFLPHGQILPLIALAMAVANVGGATLGTRLALSRGAGFVRVVFLLVVAVLIAKTAFDALGLATPNPALALARGS